MLSHRKRKSKQTLCLTVHLSVSRLRLVIVIAAPFPIQPYRKCLSATAKQVTPEMSPELTKTSGWLAFRY